MSRRVIVSGCLLVSLSLALFCGVVPAEYQGSGGGSGEPNVGPNEPNVTRWRPIPVMKYTMASPRACLIGPPIWSTNAYYLPTGAAENFPRANGGIRVPVGTRVIFCLSRELEGVWYRNSYGCLGTSLVLQMCKGCKCIDAANLKECLEEIRCCCEECKNLGVRCPEPTDTEILPCPWVTIGRDGAKDCRKGPSIGRAKVGVPIRFRRPGIYYLRGIVHTFAHPRYPLPIEEWEDRLLDPSAPDKILPPIPAAADKDVVYVRVHVVDRPIIDVEPDDGMVEDPDVIHVRPIPKDFDPNEPEPLQGDLNGDEVINLIDLAILTQQWGREYEMPFTDDE